MKLRTGSRTAIAVLALALAFALVGVDHADARRGGSFGSRGARTFAAPPATTTAPFSAGPLQRSMSAPPAYRPGPTPARPSYGSGMRRPGLFGRGFGGMFGGLLGGLMLGGLVGMLFGHGMGGFGGFLGLIVQVGLLVLVVSWFMRRRRETRAQAVAGRGPEPEQQRWDERYGDWRPTPDRFDAPPQGAPAPMDIPPARGSVAGGIGAADELGLTQHDLDRFEQLLGEVQGAFAREDYQGLRDHCTPEIVSYLSEELSQNAVKGLRNEVSDVKLLQGDVAEAWREGNDEYATVAMRYESRDWTVERSTGKLVSGDAEHPSETTELWTFVRPVGGDWKLSAIQETGPASAAATAH